MLCSESSVEAVRSLSRRREVAVEHGGGKTGVISENAEIVSPRSRSRSRSFGNVIHATIHPVPDEVSTLLKAMQREMISRFDAAERERTAMRDEVSNRFREAFSHFDAIYVHFDKLESETASLSASVSRLETRSLSRAEFESVIEDLRGRVHQLQHRLDELEKTQREN